MKVAVVTPYFEETLPVLSACHESVLAQTYACTHFLVSDGSPHAAAIQSWSARHVSLGTPHGDGGNTPRGVGSVLAMNEQFDAIAYLDADNWYQPSHIEAMVKLQRETQADICTAARSLHRTDGSLLYVDILESEGKRHVDTSCLFLTRQAFGLVPLWAMMPHELGPRCDQVFWLAIQAQKFSCAHSTEATVAYRTRYDIHYKNMREPPPSDVKHASDFLQVGVWWASLPADAKQRWHRYFSTRLL
jgi:glycosyltransferase involved in cell wall biosynthesis